MKLNTRIPRPTFKDLPQRLSSFRLTRRASESQLDPRNRHPLMGAHLPDAAPQGPLQAPALTEQLVPVYAARHLMDQQITDLEVRTRNAMGAWALYGLRYSTLVGVALATVVKLSLTLAPMTTPLIPLAGMGIFLGLLVGGIAVGAAAQSYARYKWRNTGAGSAPYLGELNLLKLQLEQKSYLTGSEVLQLRRLQILQSDIHGGFKHSVWSIVHGISGFDPQLTNMMRRAATDPTTGPQQSVPRPGGAGI